jgi:2-amino-4-hydroxy-6-hydroxymethyldihydropteridine diphosphokinase
LLALGANVPGRWGEPATSVRRVIAELESQGLDVVAASPLFVTPPLGRVRQPAFVNSVIAVSGSIAPAALLRLAKRLERSAGRRAGGRWGPRPLDVDVLAHGGRTIGRGTSTTRAERRLILPHPELHRRGFVLVPLAAILPRWRHPRIGVTAGDLLARQPGLRRGIAQLGVDAFP